MTRPDHPDHIIPPDGPETTAAIWLAEIPAARWPAHPADILVHRFDLKSWQARKAVEKAKRMQLLRRVHA